jgi:hypothetical protein
MHARKCLLKGLNPQQNRTVPPLRYEWVWALKRDFPHLQFSLNGGIITLEEVAAALAIRNVGSASTNGTNGSGASSSSEAMGEGEGEGEGEAEGQGPCSSRRSGGGDGGGGHGITGVMVGRAAYNMVWDALGECSRRVGPMLTFCLCTRLTCGTQRCLQPGFTMLLAVLACLLYCAVCPAAMPRAAHLLCLPCSRR